MSDLLYGKLTDEMCIILLDDLYNFGISLDDKMFMTWEDNLRERYQILKKFSERFRSLQTFLSKKRFNDKLRQSGSLSQIDG